MFVHVKKRGTMLLLTGLVAVGVLAGGVVAAQWHDAVSPDELDAALNGAPSTRVADIPAHNGLLGRGVFVQKTSNGLFCLWDASSGTTPNKQGGCNSTDDPLGGNRISISFAYDGGPDVATVTDARLIGLTAPEVAAVRIVMSDGTRRSVQLHEAPQSVGDFQAFGVRFTRAEIRRGVAPTAVVALSSDGTEIDRQATGFSR